MALQSERPLDSTDWKIIRELQQDSRLSSNELGRRVGLSAPATAERVRKLEDTEEQEGCLPPRWQKPLLRGGFRQQDQQDRPWRT